MFRKLRKRYLCWRYGICPVHNLLRPHGDYHVGRWGICRQCAVENEGKNHLRNSSYEFAREKARERIRKDWTPYQVGEKKSS